MEPIFVDKNHWLIIPNSGNPFLMSRTASEEYVKEFVTKQLEKELKTNVSFQVMRYFTTAYKSKEQQQPSSKTLLDLHIGEKVYTKSVLNPKGDVIEHSKEHLLKEPYYIEVGKPVGYLKTINEIDGSTTEFSVCPAGNDSNGSVYLRF